MHTSQLNSAMPSVDFTRQHLDANAEELKYLHPRYDASSAQSTQAGNLLQATITDEILHEIIAQSPFFGRLHHLYLSDSQFQDIRQVPRAKILADLAKLIALDQATGQTPGVSTMKTFFDAEKKLKEPARCTACSALNTTCSPTHCKSHPPIMTTPQAQRLRRMGQNPATLKTNCPSCTQNAQGRESRPTEKVPQSGYKSKSRSKSKDRQQKNTSQPRESENRNSPRYRSPPKVRAILTNPDRTYTSTNGPPYDETPRQDEDWQTRHEQQKHPYRESRQRDNGHTEWNYARQAYPQDTRYARQEHSQSPHRQRWRQRSPTPDARYGQYRQRSKSPQYRSNSPHDARPRSQSAHRYPPRTPSTNRYPRSRSASQGAPPQQNDSTGVGSTRGHRD